jgi:hypothetical protein
LVAALAGKTVIRAGYGIGYERLPLYLIHNNSGLAPGLSETDVLTSASLLTVASLVLPVKPAGAPLAPIPITGTGSHTQNLFAFDQNLRTPYVQNYNFSIQRELAPNTWLTLSYAGSKGTKLCARSTPMRSTSSVTAFCKLSKRCRRAGRPR